MNERHEAKLLEDYIQALRQNPNASPPAHLDVSTAEFARTLARTQVTQQLSRHARARIWQSALSQATYSSTKEINRMDYSIASHSPRTPMRPFTMIASLLLFALIGVTIVMMSFSLKPQNNDTGAALAQVTPSEEGTENDVAVVTPTLIPVLPTPISGDSIEAVGSPYPVIPTVVPYFGDTHTEGYVAVVTTYIEIPAGTRIREDMLVTVLWPVYQTPSGSFQSMDQVVGSYASTHIARFMPILDEYIGESRSSIQELQPTGTLLPTLVPSASPTFTPSPTHTMTPESR